MSATFENLVDLLNTKPNPMTLAAQLPFFAEAMGDLGTRLANIEHAHLEEKFRLDAVEARLTSVEGVLNSQSDTLQRDTNRIDNIEKAPAANVDRIDKLDARMRTVEGAVGSKNYKAPAPAPIVTPAAKPAVTPQTQPAPAAIPSTAAVHAAR